MYAASAFYFREAAPDPVWLLGRQGVIETLPPYTAPPADPLCPLLPRSTIGRRLGVINPEEQDRRELETGCILAPLCICS